MIILGIDPGYGRCGYGIIEQIGQKQQVLAYGCIETSSKMPHVERLQAINTALNQLILKYNPQKAGVEELFFAKNKTTALKVAEARGVILLTLAKNKLEILELSPNQIKQAMTGYGNADKKQMQQMVKISLKLEEIPQPDDAADALAIAITTATWKTW